MQIPTDLASWPPHEAQAWLMDLEYDQAVTDDEYAAARAAVNKAILGTTQPWAYLVERTDDARPADRRTLRYGHHHLAEGFDLADFARRLADDTRAAHSYYSGPLRVSVWPHQEGKSHPRVRYEGPPASAQRYEYPDVADDFVADRFADIDREVAELSDTGREGYFGPPH
jgi:hypothetical protein